MPFSYSRDKHPRVWAIAIWLLTSAAGVLIGWVSGKLQFPPFVFWTLFVIWLVVWIAVSTGLHIVFQPPEEKDHAS